MRFSFFFGCVKKRDGLLPGKDICSRDKEASDWKRYGIQTQGRPKTEEIKLIMGAHDYNPSTSLQVQDPPGPHRKTQSQSKLRKRGVGTRTTYWLESHREATHCLEQYHLRT